MKQFFVIITFLITIFLGTSLYLFRVSANINPKEAYEVYIDGRSIGFIKDKNKLETYIDNEQQTIKEQYQVDKVYMPLGVKIQKRVTYSNNFKTERELYKIIKKAKLFAIDGYEIQIKGSKQITLNVLERKMFVDALDKTIKNFVDPSLYEAYANDKEVVIESTGARIEDARLQETITIKKTLISTGDYIFTNMSDINKFLLFGNLEEQKEYTVGYNETLEQIAFKNNLSIEEIMVANPGFKSANTLLYNGQQINIGLINPVVHIEVEQHVVSDKELKYDSETRFDQNLMAGYSRVDQAGQNGLVRVSEKIKYVNGEMIPPVIRVTSTVLKPAVNEVVVRGGKMYANIGSGSWRWPTLVPYTLTSPFGYRWGRRHTGIDISGTGGTGSPIFASNNGVVTQSGYNDAYGISVTINHNNGFYTMYAHLVKAYVKDGQIVSRGQVIGGMGNTGRSYGTHLHFEIRSGDPKANGTPLNPLQYL